MAYQPPCSHCGEPVELRPDGTVSTHDFPVPCRSVCPGSGQKPSPVSLVEYSQEDIDNDRQNARWHFVVVPGLYAFHGPEGDEIASGPFLDRRSAVRGYKTWRE